METAARRVGTRRFRKCTKNLRNANISPRKNVFVCAAPAVDSPRHRSMRHVAEREPTRAAAKPARTPVAKNECTLSQNSSASAQKWSTFRRFIPTVVFHCCFPLRACAHSASFLLFAFTASPFAFNGLCISLLWVKASPSGEMSQWIVYQRFRGEGVPFTEKAKPETQMKKTSPLDFRRSRRVKER